MAVYRIWPATSGAADTGDYTTTDLGLQFHVTTTTCTLTGYYWWLPATDDTTGTNYSFRLYSTTNGTTGTLISGTTVAGSGTWTAGAWNFTPLTPVALTSGTIYVAVSSHTSGAKSAYGATALYWNSGGGSAGLTSGPISVPGSGTALNSATSAYNEPEAGTFPATASTANYWLDIQGTDSGAAAAAPRHRRCGRGGARAGRHRRLLGDARSSPAGPVHPRQPRRHPRGAGAPARPAGCRPGAGRPSGPYLSAPVPPRAPGAARRPPPPPPPPPAAPPPRPPPAAPPCPPPPPPRAAAPAPPGRGSHHRR